jgi:hypothetical protein
MYPPINNLEPKIASLMQLNHYQTPPHHRC